MKGILGLVGALVFSLSAHAQVIYTYQGAPLPSFSDGYLTLGTLTGSFTLSSPLAENGTQVLDPIDWSFSGDPLLNLTTSNLLEAYHEPLGDGSGAIFSITTVNGNITAWDFELGANEGKTTDFREGVSESITSHGDSYLLFSCNGGAPGVPPCSTVTASNSTAGTLTKAPEIDPASTASALTLLLGGIAVMRSRRARG